MTLQEIVEAVGLSVLSHGDAEKQVRWAYLSDILSDVMAKAPKSALWITHQLHENIVALAYFKGLSGIILPEGNLPDTETLQKARSKRIAVFSTSETAFDVAGRLYVLGLRGRP
ncbi:MAG: serine kinase [candidate division KSB1 bacterium]|nr:serine kinase [candidate division KSB1 bacterium]